MFSAVQSLLPTIYPTARRAVARNRIIKKIPAQTPRQGGVRIFTPLNRSLVWSLDRFSREGMAITIGYLQRLTSHGVAFRDPL
jgi:hypothetical protein